MSKISSEQRLLFDELHRSRQEDFKTLNKRSYKGIWSSIVDKYPETAHFVYELLQNADDACATEVYIVLKRDKMLFKHNGTKHFDVTPEDARNVGDINSITGIGDSSKTDLQNKIGKFGVGFKAVFQYTDTPLVYDETFKFKIENFIIPTLLEEDHPEREAGETLFVFPFKNKTKSFEEISDRLRTLKNPILFLRHLQKITWRIDSSVGRIGEEVVFSKEIIKTKKDKDNDLRMDLVLLNEPNSVKQLFLFSRDVIITNEGKKSTHPIFVGYFYDEKTKRLITKGTQNIFCFFPTKETFKTCFISHAPFLLTDNRQNLKPGEQLNSSLVKLLAKLAADAVVFLRDYKSGDIKNLINENITEIIPNREYSWYSTNMFEDAIHEAFEGILTEERLFLSRNGNYVSAQEAYIPSPRELADLVSQDQLVSLVGIDEDDEDYEDYELYLYEKENCDFLKPELAQRLEDNTSDLFSDITTYTSEDLARNITSDFMNLQDLKWVVRFYNYLRSNALKLWRATEVRYRALKDMPFRSAPIIKTQIGEWVAPFIDGDTPNVFLPLSKGGNSEYNFVNEEYLSNAQALRFFNELEIKEPDELNYITAVILPKYEGDSISANDDEIIDHFKVLFQYYLKIRGTKQESSFIDVIKGKLYLKGNDGYYWRPYELYYQSPELKLYFKGKEGISFLQEDFYKSAFAGFDENEIRFYLTKLGIRRYPKVLSRTYYSRYSAPDLISGNIPYIDGSKTNIEDIYLDGFEECCSGRRMTKELSLFIWNELLPKIDFAQHKELTFTFRRKYARSDERQCYPSSFILQLQNYKWIYDLNGKKWSAKDIALEDLDPLYDRNNGLIQFLGIEKREKSIIELGGTKEQQEMLDFGKQLKRMFGDDLTIEEMIKALTEVKAKKSGEAKRDEHRPQSSSVSKSGTPKDSSSDDAPVKESVRDKLKKSWDAKSQEHNHRPHSTRNSSLISELNTPNATASNDETVEFDGGSSSTGGSAVSKKDSTKAQKNLKSRKTEAEESAEKANELVEIMDMLNETKPYTYLWYKVLMTLMHANKSNKSTRKAQIDFYKNELVHSDKILHLSKPSAPIPDWVLDSESVSIIAFYEGKTKKIDGQIVMAQEDSLDLSIEFSNELEEVCVFANKIRVTIENNINFIDSLERRFLQLQLPDDYDMNENLPKDIEFIYGPPGTGKTTRLVERVHKILEKEKRKKILILTPTNKAADIIATKMVDDSVCYDYLIRFGATESIYLIEDAAVVSNRDTTVINLDDSSVLVTTAARFAYDCFQPDDTFICDYKWDYIIIDEASMMDILSITNILYSGNGAKFIIAGDPKQIQPVTQNDMPEYNIYDMVGLDGFGDAVNNYTRFKVEGLTTQYRSIPAIGKLVSDFCYDGMVKPWRDISTQKPLKIKGLDIANINFIGFDVIEFDQLKGLTAVGKSAFNLYAAIFTYSFAEYIAKNVQSSYPGKSYSIGIVCPYKAEADAIKNMLESRPLSNEVCSVECGTVHSFQGDECDIMLVVMNPPSECTSGSHINNENIINVAMSRTRDYLFFILPNGQTKGFSAKYKIGSILPIDGRKIFKSSNIEKLIFGKEDHITQNTNVSCHMPVNVYCEDTAEFEVRISDTAVDIKINK